VAAEAQFRYAETFEMQNDFKQAAVEYLKVKYLYGSYLSWVLPAVYRAGLANEKLENWGEARKIYQSILENYRDETYQNMARERLRALAGK